MPKYKLAVFDVNGVLTPEHTVVELAKLVGSTKKERFDNYSLVEKIIEKHTSGQKSLAETFDKLAGRFEGLTLEDMVRHSARFKLMPGIHEMAATLIENKLKLAIITTGFDVTVQGLNDRVLKHITGSLQRRRYSRVKLPYPNVFHPVECNHLTFTADGRHIPSQEVLRAINRGTEKYRRELVCDGKIDLLVPENKTKGDRIAEVAQMHRVPLKQVVAVGDSMGDKDMIEKVAMAGGLGLAFNANEPLREFAEGKNPAAMMQACARLNRRRRPLVAPDQISDRMVVVSKKGRKSDLRDILPYILPKERL